MSSDIHLHALEWNIHKPKDSPILRMQAALFSLIYKLQATGILVSNNIEIFLNVFDLVECLSFPFHMKYRSLYTKNASSLYIMKLFDITSTFFAYFTLMPFYNKISTAYYVTICFAIVMILLTVVFVYVVTYFKMFNYISLKLIKFSLYIITNCLYLPMMMLFLCPYYYPYDSNHKVTQRVFFVLGLCMSVVLFVLSYVTKAILYDHKQKMTSINDLYLLLMKTLLCLIYTFFNDQYLLSIMTFLCSVFMFYHCSFDNDNKQLKAQLAQMTLSLTFLWGSTVVFIVNVFNGLFDLNFNGGVLLFYGGLIIIIITCFFFDYNRAKLKMLLLSIEKCSDGLEASLHILTVLQLISAKEKANTRENDIFLEGYIKNYEDMCTTPNCPLKKYTFGDYSERKNLARNHLNTLIILLYQHIEVLFKNALNRFPSCVRLRLYYIEFLNEVMHKRTHALSELYHIIRTGSIQTFEENYLIFKFSNELCAGEDVSKYASHENKVASFGYGTEYKQLKKEMLDASMLYVEFWNLLMEERDDDNIRGSKVNKLNSLGTQITHKIEEIEMKFHKLTKKNTRNIEIYYCYSEFLGNILNKTEEAEKYKNEFEKMLFIKNSDSNQNYMSDYNNDLSEINDIIANMNKTDQFQYIIISANNENFGVIENISLNLCIILGYTRDELVGKKIDIIIPELLQKEHNKMLHVLTNEFRRKIINTSFTGANSLNEVQHYKQNTVFAMDKAKYLIELTMIPGITHSDVYGFSFVARMINKNMQHNIESYYCNVFTNSSFLIQSFTTSALHILGFNSHYVNSNIDLTKMIKQFFAEFLRGIVDLESLHKRAPSALEKIKLKQEIANKYMKQNVPMKVHFKLYEIILNEQGHIKSSRLNHNDTLGGTLFKLNNNATNNNNKEDKFSSRTNTIDDTYCNNNRLGAANIVEHGGHKSKNIKISSMSTTGNSEDNFIMEIRKVSVNGKGMGYMFKFEPLKYSLHVQAETNITGSNINNNVVNNSSSSYLNLIKTDTPKTNQVTKKKTASSIGLFRLKDSLVSETILMSSNLNYTKFIIDPLTMSYSTNIDKKKEFKDSIKELAFQKLQYLNPKSVHETSNTNSNDSYDEDNESYEEDESDSHISDNDNNNNHRNNKGNNGSSSLSKSHSNTSSGVEEMKNVALSARTKHKRKTKFGTFIQPAQPSVIKVNKPPPDDTYYNVSMLNIKLLIYNFERNAIVECPIIHRYSKVEQIIKGYGEGNDFHKGKDSLKSQNELLHSNDLPLGLKNRRNSMNDMYTNVQQDIIQKQIEQKLQKKETHKSIIYMTLISICFVLLMLGYSVLYFVLYYYAYKSYRSYFVLFGSTLFVISNQLHNIYNVRELTLLNYSKYTAYIESYEKDMEIALTSMEKIYNANYNYLNNITKLSKRVEPELNVTNTLYLVINNTSTNEYEINSYELTIIPSIHQINTAIWNILHNGGDYRPLESNVFFYLHNAIKGGYKALLHKIDFSREDMNENFSNTITLISVVTFAVIPVFVILCIVLCKMVDVSLKKKGDFLAIFFEIGKSTIKASLDRCEVFMLKLQSDNLLCEMNEDDDLQDVINNIQLKDQNRNVMNKQTKNKRSHRNDNNSLSQNTNNKNTFMYNKNKHHQNQEAHFIKFVLCLFFIIIYIMFLICYLLFHISTKELKRFISSFEIVCENQNEYIKLIDNIMEYCFNSSLYIDIDKYDGNITNYMLHFMTDVYEMDNTVPKDTKHLPRKFHKIYHELYSHDICVHVNDKHSNYYSYFKFPEGKNCSDLLFGSSQYGLRILLSTYIVQMLDIKNTFYSNSKAGSAYNVKYNLTLIGTDKDPDNEEKSQSDRELYDKYHPIIEFNGVTVTFNQQMYRFVIQPAFDKLQEVFFMEIIYYMNSTKTFFFVYIAFTMLIILLSYLIGWLPFAKETNNIIYKTKNMLMIIPIDILRNMPSVYKVLKIYVNKQTVSSKGGIGLSDK